MIRQDQAVITGSALQALKHCLLLGWSRARCHGWQYPAVPARGLALLSQGHVQSLAHTYTHSRCQGQIICGTLWVLEPLARGFGCWRQTVRADAPVSPLCAALTPLGFLDWDIHRPHCWGGLAPPAGICCPAHDGDMNTWLVDALPYHSVQILCINVFVFSRSQGENGRSLLVSVPLSHILARETAPKIIFSSFRLGLQLEIYFIVFYSYNYC